LEEDKNIEETKIEDGISIEEDHEGFGEE